MNNLVKISAALISISVFSTVAQPLSSVIITKGKGGDFHAGRVLKDSLPNSHMIDVQSISKDTLTHSKCSLIVGQGAIDTILTNSKLKQALKQEPIAIYSHLLDNKISNFVRHNIGTNQRINLFVTNSQLLKLKLQSPSVYNQILAGHSNIHVYTAPMAASSTTSSS